MTSRFAYVWLLFGGNLYVPGALVSAYSCKQVNNIYPRVCMVTHDVDKKLLGLDLFHEIIEVDHLQYKTKKLNTKQQQQIYKKWIHKSYTKWNCLKLTQYSKILFLDADTIFLKNTDHLFDREAPAGTFTSPWSSRYVENGFNLIYPEEDNSVITPEMVKQSLNLLTNSADFPKENLKENQETKTECSIVVIAGSILLEPNLEDFENLQIFLFQNQPFGIEGCNSGPDEQAITYYYSIIKQKDWRHIHQNYNSIPWKEYGVTDPHIIHYFHTKPWLENQDKWSDFKIFYDLQKKMKEEQKS
jgi:lipopolysaccharide biosynthesis glycosyltransferase